MNIRMGLNKGVNFAKETVKAVYEDIASEGPALKELAGIIKSKAEPRIRLARMEAKSAIKEARKYNKEYNIWDEVKQAGKDFQRLKEDIKEACKIGEVTTTGIRNNKKAKHIIDTSKDGLSAYAKANKLNISFYTPEIDEISMKSRDIKKPLNVTVERSEGAFGTHYFETKTIDGDIANTTVHTDSKIEKVGDKKRVVKTSVEDNFLRRSYRAVEELKNKILNRKADEKLY